MHLIAYRQSVPLRPPAALFPGAKAAVFRVFQFCFLLLVANLLQGSTHAYGQEKITLSLKNASMVTVFRTIESQSSYHFWFEDTVLAGCKPVTLEIREASLEQVLEICMKEQPITYKIVRHTIVIKKKGAAGGSVEGSVSGTIQGQDGPLAGASVRIRGGTIGTTSDEQGHFLLSHVPMGATLLVSAVGYEYMEMAATAPQPLDVQLKLSPKKLDESVVIAYGQVSRQANTAGLTEVGDAQLQRQPVTNVLGALSANVPGLAIAQSTGLPGSGYSVLIRGQNSLTSGTEPLYVVDGIPFPSTSLVSTTTSAQILPFSNPLSSINPADILSVTVLKDADATAIYGSRGSNGVVLITTKKATEGASQVDLHAMTGIGRIAHSLSYLNTDQYLQMRHEAFANDGATPQASDYDVNGVFDTTRYTDWKHELIGSQSSITNIGGGVTGGNAQTQYLLSGGFIRETPPIPGNFKDDKGSAHLQASHQSADGKLHSSISAMYLDETNRLPTQDPTYAVGSLPPNAPAIYDSAGNLNWLDGIFNNPFSIFKRYYRVHTSNLTASTTFSYRIYKGLQLKIDAGYNQVLVDEQRLVPLTSYNPSNGLTSGAATFAHHAVKSWNIEPQLHYRRNIFRGQLQMLAGATFQSTSDAAQTISASGFASDALLANLQAATSVTVAQNSASLYRYNAFFGRVTYNWQDRYLLNLSGRRDGSSRFGPGRRFSNFGAIGAGWVFSRAAFAKGLNPVVSFGKLRASYGITGNDRIGDYNYLASYQPTPRPYMGNPSLYPVRLFNPDYSWEKNKKLELALELGLARDRVWYTVSYYQNRSSNQLVGYPLSTVTGFSSVQFNLPATIENSGWEMELSSQNISSRTFEWKTAFNITIPTSKLLAFPGLAGSSYAYTYLLGKSLDTRPKFKSLGVDPATGTYQFASSGQNGAPTTNPAYPTELIKPTKIGRKFYGGLENTLRYGHWELDVLFQFIKQTAYNYIGTAASAPGFYGNQPVQVLDRWQKPGDHKPVQRFTQDYASDAYNGFINAEYYGDNAISDASFIRLKNLVISYDLPAPTRTKLHLKDSRLFLQAQNLLTITSYPGMDPESQYSTSLPPLRVWTAGIKVTF